MRAPAHQPFADFLPDDDDGKHPKGTGDPVGARVAEQERVIETGDVHNHEGQGDLGQDRPEHRSVSSEALPVEHGGELGLADKDVGNLGPHDSAQERTLGRAQHMDTVRVEFLVAVTAPVVQIVVVLVAHGDKLGNVVVLELVIVDNELDAVAAEHRVGEAKVREAEEEGKEASDGLKDADRAIGNSHHLDADEMLCVLSRRYIHGLVLGLFVGKRDGGGKIGSKIDEQNHNRLDTERDLERNKGQEGNELRDVGREHICDGLLEVLKDETAFANAVDNGSKVVVEQNDLTGLLGDGGARAHGNADVGGLERRGVVDTVTGHGDDVAELVELADNVLLLLRHGACKDDFLVGKHTGPVLGCEGQHLSAVNNNGSDAARRDGLAFFLELVLGRAGDEIERLCNCMGRDRVVARDHEHTDTGVVALLDRRLD
eukprot:comp16298_c0_seq1/m.25900 comp16298_c0_seq1/g.25900  ORF comp16298_c0_seq1/g.25900 comp16298_c0_seq1/m.25900 type:complete len:430 (-) comp16298_c0_seq1:1704-2993(-)